MPWKGIGNGHISRSQDIVRYLTRFAEVEVLISGVQHEVDFRLDVPTYWAHGLELAFGTQGGVGYWATGKRLKMLLLLRDIRRLAVQRYDVVVSDFGPISAWSAYLHRTPCVTLSHHAAFLSPRVPRPPVKRPLAEWLMRWYASAADAIGLHFQAYDDFIKTPIIRQAIREATITNQGHYTVYLPAFADSYLIKLFSRITTVRWEIFSKRYRHQHPSTQGRITIAPIADQAFIRSVAGCEGLVTGAGFETPAEALYLGKKLLVIPMKGQYEQQCNAAALQEMGIVAASTLHVEGLQLWEGDGSYFTQVAHQYALSDNYHQAIMGGTGANHLAIGFGTTLFYEDAAGHPATPPANQIENPNPQPNTNNFYTQDGYSGGSYVKCADVSQPGVESILSYLDSLPYRPFNDGNCQPNAYYLVNNYNSGYRGDGTPAPLGPQQFTIPPSQQPNLGLLLTKHAVSWKYYGEGWANGQETGENSSYCNICNPFQYSTQSMTNPTLRLNLQDVQQLYADIQNSTLPSVSIVKPDVYLDGHLASSKFELFEEFCRKIIDTVQANQALWQDTAIMITVDEGGGYYDSGYIQPIDFFGDGSRIPLLVVSPHAESRGVVHTYYDHMSFDKFVEANWGLGETISEWSRDNLPNPIASADNVYVPFNSPAIGDLMEMFNFHAAD